MVAQNDLVLVVDYGAQYSHFVARLVRDTRVYSEIVPRNTSLAKILDRKPKAVILSDGLCSVREPSSSQLEAGLLAAGVPTFNVAAQRLDGEVCHPALLELGPERQVLEQFLFETAGCRPTWTAALIVEDQIARIRAQVGNARAICGLSGGVDSAVSAALVQKAIGSQLTCVFVDHGLVRQGEREQVERDFVAVTGANLKVVDATEQFLGYLAGVSDPETKRKIIGREFIRVFEAAAREIISETPDGEEVRFLVQGTIYPDVVESGAGDGTGVIKSHHNVGGLPEDLQFSLIEPLRELFKDEVRQVGRELGLPGDMVERHPFPGPGLGIRIVGAIDAERLRILRAADAIVREESKAAGIDREVWQFPVVLLADVRSVGVTGEERTYGHPIVLRPILSTDAMTADWAKLPYEFIELVSNRITSEVPEINRVVLDVTSKPPATIEWE